MTTTPNSPISPDPHESSKSGIPTGEPTWGTDPGQPPSGSGTDHAPGAGTANGWATQPSGYPTAPPNRNDAGARPGAHFFDGVRRLGVVRPDHGRWAAGVAAGIAQRLGVAPVVVRIAFVVLTLFGGLGIALYGLGWLFLPHPDGRIHAQQVLNGTVTAGFVGALLMTLAALHHVLPVLVIALVVVLIVRHRRTRTHHAC
jgi:phage shock protein PspC (stress-responsive transcriptional regulator)